MRVLLINPPSPPGTTLNREGAAGLGNCYERVGAFMYPPQTLAVAAAILRRAGHAPALLDATAEQWSAATTRQHVIAGHADAVVVLLSWSGWENDLGFCSDIKRSLSAPVIAIGATLRLTERAAAAASASDLVLVGEPEMALPAAVDSALTNQGSRGRLDDGRIARSHELEPAAYDDGGYMLDLDALPFPAWELAPVERYRILTLLGSRGCDAGCAYCPYAVGWGARFRACCPGRVVDELEWVHRQFKPSRLMFRDPVFGYDRARVVGICEEIMRRGVRVSWECESRPEHFDAELLRLMQRAGCATVKVGFESADVRRLTVIGRIQHSDDADFYLDRVRNVVEVCRRIGLRCHLFVMAGWPNADEAEVECTTQFLQELEPTFLSVKNVESYPCTPWTEAGGKADLAAAQRCQQLWQGLTSRHPDSRRSLWTRGATWVRRHVLNQARP